MVKVKAKIVTAAIMLMLSAIIWMTLQNSINAFRVIEGFFGVYGYIRFGMDGFNWMKSPEKVISNNGKRVRQDA